MPKKKITIEYLAGMVKRGFDGVDKKFEKVDRRFENIDKKFDKVDQRFDVMDKKFGKRFKSADERFDKIIATMATKDDLRLINERLNKLEESVRSLTDAVDKFIKMMMEYRQEQIFMGERMNRHEEWIKIIADKAGVELKV